MRKLIPLLALVVASSVGAQQSPGTASTSDAGAAAYGNNITFNSSAPEVQKTESVQRIEGTQRIENSGETHQYVEYGGTHKVKNSSQAYAPPVGVTAPCIIGTSVGVAGMGWGVSGGTGIADAGCERRAAAALMHAWGHQDAAKEVLCVDPTIAAAYARAGIPCKAVSLTAAAVPVSTRTGASPTTVENYQQCYADPLVAKRAQVPVCQ